MYFCWKKHSLQVVFYAALLYIKTSYKCLFHAEKFGIFQAPIDNNLRYYNIFAQTRLIFF